MWCAGDKLTQGNMEVPTLGHPPTDARDPNALAHLGSSTYRPLFRKPSKKLSFLQLQRSREIEVGKELFFFI